MALSWQLPEELSYRIVDEAWIAMADNVRLSARLWLPQSAARVPVVLEYIPYRKRDLYRAHDEMWGAVLAAHGIAYARVDVRGTGDSEGVITDEYSEAELDDGVAVITWLAEQPWCSGAVGMRGISWGGINTLQIATRAPRALKAIMPMAACDNRFAGDAHYVGGVLARANFQWGTLFKLVMASPPGGVSPEESERLWRGRLEAAPSILKLWTEHQREDSYWRRGSADSDYDAIHCPVYAVAGWSDPYSGTIGRLLERLSVPRKGLIGPWGHTYPYLAAPCGLDWRYEELRWWHHWLNGEETGLMAEPMLRVFMPYATASQCDPKTPPGRWISEETWPAATVLPRRFHLVENALSDQSAADDAVLSISGAAIVGMAKAEWIDKLAQEQSEDDAHSLCFNTSPLTEALEILGEPVLRLRVAADKAVAHVAARLTDIAPDGTSQLVTYTLRNLTHRVSHGTPEPLEAGRFYDAVLPLASIAHRFRKGHRLRLALSENLWPLAWPSPEIATLFLALDACWLELPVRACELAVAGSTEPPAQVDERPRSRGDGIRFLRTDEPVAFAADGMRITRSRKESADIVAGNPGSCRWVQEARTQWEGNGFDCEIRARSELTSGPAVFHLTERLEALKDGRIIFLRENASDIVRDLM